MWDLVVGVAAVLNILVSSLLWEIVHALFDRSDAALSQLTIEGIVGQLICRSRSLARAGRQRGSVSATRHSIAVPTTLEAD